MSIFKHFAARTALPVKVDEIADWIVSNGFAVKINYHPMDRSPEIVSGLIRVERYKPQYSADELVIADIPYSTQMPETEQRVIGAKEVIHILDGDEYVSASYDQVSNLLSEIVIPPELMTDMAKLTGIGLFDHSGILRALAVLFPMAAREILLDLKGKGHIGDKEIAALAALPEEYIPFLLSGRWELLLRKICK